MMEISMRMCENREKERGYSTDMDHSNQRSSHKITDTQKLDII